MSIVFAGFHTFKRYFLAHFSHTNWMERRRRRRIVLWEKVRAGWWHLKSQGAQMILISILIFFGFWGGGVGSYRRVRQYTRPPMAVIWPLEVDTTTAATVVTGTSLLGFAIVRTFVYFRMQVGGGRVVFCILNFVFQKDNREEMKAREPEYTVLYYLLLKLHWKGQFGRSEWLYY